MDTPFDQWAKAEIARLRLEADVLQRALDKYQVSQGKSVIGAPPPKTNGARPHPPLRARRGKGGKREFVLAKIGESGETGAATDDLFVAVEEAKLGMKRASLRAMLYHEKKSGHIKLRAGRYVLTQEGPTA